MKIVAISDLHGYFPEEIPECDLLVLAGDVCPVWNHDRSYQAKWLRNEFTDWLNQVPAKRKIGIPGNHDFVFQDNARIGSELPWIFLNDDAVEIDGIKFYGTPWTPKFGNWAFMNPDSSLGEKWDKIPYDTQVLISHGPPYGTNDITTFHRSFNEDLHVGSATLANRLLYGNFPDLKLLIHGHIHEGYGQTTHEDGRVYACVSHMDEDYKPVNKPMEFEVLL